MNSINWQKEAEKRKDDILSDLKGLLRIKSVLREEEATKDAPLGLGPKEALLYMIELGKKDGFIGKNVGNLAGHLQFGQGEKLIGVLCHVDVVPAGDGWSSDPFQADIRNGKIYARGAIDDKGPTMAAYYAIKIIKELQLPLKKRIRLIIGTDEESDWRCVNRYFESEEMPAVGFAPDADFPIIFAEKGIADLQFVQDIQVQGAEQELAIKVHTFEAGLRYNMVPDFAKVRLSIFDIQTQVLQSYQEFLKEKALNGKFYIDHGYVILELEGISAHGSLPENGKNAGVILSEFLSLWNLDDRSRQYFRFIQQYFARETRGTALGIAFSDEISGELTVNAGILAYSEKTGGKLGINIRYPVTMDYDKLAATLTEKAVKHHFQMEVIANSKPHHVEKDHPLIHTLRKVYEEQTGDQAELLAIGGGTYARSLKAGVAFGPLFPGREDVAHQKDEYMWIEDLLKATAIYAQAIYELAK
ncbi:dipeptidase PepV [Bacillaceae bacterium Marseille-Q3522]|nr:dipeptidase PepV [Bacillaceae bacterium Marseille-Q3522]